MSSIFPFIVIGLVTGSVYSLGGIGLVLTYRTSGIFNFGYGAIATIGAYVFYALHVQAGWSWPLAALVAVPLVGTLLGLLFEPFARALSRGSVAMQVAGTVGLILIVEAAAVILYGQGTLNFPGFLPAKEFGLFGAAVSVAQIITVALVLAITVALYLFLNKARLGVAMRGVVDNEALLDLSGTSPTTVRRYAWILGCTLATLSGVLLAPSVSLDATTLILLVIQTFGAAAIGRFSSLPWTYAGGLALGVASAVLTEYLNTSSTILLGLAPSLAFIVLFLILLFMPKGWLPGRQRIVPIESSWLPPWRVTVAAGVVATIALAFVPQLVGFRTGAWTTALAFVVLFLSLGLLVRGSGQVSLCQMSFAAIGAAAFSKFAVGLGLPWGVALLVSGLIAVPIGALLAIPAVRLGGIYLALATFGFGLLVSLMFFNSTLMFGVGGISEPMPGGLAWLSSNPTTAFYYVVLAIVVIVTVSIICLTRSRLGRLLRAMADSPLALTTNGTNIAITQVIVFSMSAFLAAIAGALYGVTSALTTSFNFQPITSLTLLALVVIVPGRAPWYALLAAAGFVLVPVYVSNGNVAEYLQIFFGLNAMFYAIIGPPKLPASIKALIDRIGQPRVVDTTTTEIMNKKTCADDPKSSYLSHHEESSATEDVLEVAHLSVNFGGLRAVQDLSLEVPAGRITGLIGPNGAGKTTTFNACSGLVQVSGGQILLNGVDVTRYSPSRRARLGLGRTFQQMELFNSLTVAENVAIGREANLTGLNPIAHVLSRPSDRAVIASAVTQALELCGISDLANVNAGSLSTGQRRLVELSRCLAGAYRILLLDEPSSGLDRSETRQFGTILQRVVDEEGVGILLVEHDMELVLQVCEHIYVVEFGLSIFDGSRADVTHSPLVQAAYMGAMDEQMQGST
jgi:ABC-type branched-subunit amino acid transport system ATPase component/branched-subunit amino acid ABC-type transport system permease component